MDSNFLLPNEYAHRLATKTIQHEMDIACEIFIARGRAIHYADLMDSKNENMATKTMLVSWLNDFTRNNEVKRKGIINLYKQAFPQHFENGKWQARNMVVFVDYAVKRLKDKQLIKDSKRVSQFIESIGDEKWFWQAISIICIKLVEDLFTQNALKSSSAKALIDQIMIYRKMIDDMGKIVGRVGKTKDLDSELKDRVYQMLQDGAKQSLICAVDALGNYEENAIFEKYQGMIQVSLGQVLEGNVAGRNSECLAITAI